MLKPTLGFLLHDVARLLRRRFEQRAGESGLTRSQWQAVAYLAKHEGISQAGLADLLEIEPITLTRILDRLAEKGLVQRRPHPTDRRSWSLYLTEAARPLLQEMERIAETIRTEALQGVAPEHLEALSETLTRMKANLWPNCQNHSIEKESAHG